MSYDRIKICDFLLKFHKNSRGKPQIPCKPTQKTRFIPPFDSGLATKKAGISLGDIGNLIQVADKF
jgi:hypothetical protein